MVKQYLTLKYSYAIAFILLAFWALFAYVTMHSLIDAQNKYAKLINLSGKQRMLSQKTALMVARYEQEKDERLLIHLKELSAMEINEHRFITANIESDKLRNAYFAEPLLLDQFVVQYNSMLVQYIQTKDSKLVSKILDESFQLVPKLNEAVSLFEAESNEKIEYLKLQELWIFIATLVTLVLEAVFLIRPIMNKLSAQFDVLEKLLEEKTKEVYLHSKVFKYSLDGIIICDSGANIIDANQSFTKITGYERFEVLGQKPSILKSGQHKQQFYEQMWASLYADGFWNGKVVNQKKDGLQFYEDLTILAIKDENEKIINYIGIMNDVTVDYTIQKQLHELAHYDQLTKLANRNLMYDRLRHALEVAKRNSTFVVVVFIDLDNFKIINDTMGHDKGDELLKEIATRLKAISRDSDSICRLGGDEFLVILEAIHDINGATVYLEKLKKVIAKPFYIESSVFNPTASIGVSIYPKDATEIHELVKFADLAMYKSKECGKNGYSFYTDELNEKVLKKLQMERDIEYAIVNNEFILHYQPKVNPYLNSVQGCEALIRWQKEDQLIYPGAFIPIAEESLLIEKIGELVLQKACEQLQRWNDTIFEHLTISVNVSGKQFLDPNFIYKIKNLLREYEISGNRLIFEITEYSLVENVQKTTQILNELKELGIYSAIDDFGVGYSSLNYLRKLPLKYLKVDKSFVDDMLVDADGAVVTKTILAMSKSLNLKTIAEGVENYEQVEFLKKEHCDLIQGYYYSKPLSIMEFEEFAKKRVI